MDRRTYLISKTKYFNNMIVTTTPTIEGHTIKEYKGQAIDEEQQEDSCFLEYLQEGQFVRGH